MPLNIAANIMQTAHHIQYKSRNFLEPVQDKEMQKVKRRESDAKCRANLSHSFERLKKQVLDDTSLTSRVSREMILQETLWKIQYLEGVMILLEQTKDKQDGKDLDISAHARLDAIHREFSKFCSSSIHGNKKPKMMSDNVFANQNKPKMIPLGHANGTRVLQKPFKATNMVTDQVVPKPAAQRPWNAAIASPPHTIIVPYITSRKYQEKGPQEVPVCYRPGAQQMTSQKVNMLPMVPKGYLTDDMTDSAMTTPDGTPNRRYKIKGSSIESVPMDDEMCEEDQILVPDLTCKEIFPYWLDREAERRERQPRTVTPLKPPNTCEVTQPYPMAPRKIRNTHWSAKYMQHLHQSHKHKAGFKKLQQRPGKRLFTEMTGNGGVVLDDDLVNSSHHQNYGYIDMHGGRPKRQYRKLCTAARVRPYNPVTGKVASPAKGDCRNRSARRKMDQPAPDPEFHLNSYYKRRMKQKGKGKITAVAAVPQRRVGKRTVSPPTVYGYNDGEELMRDSKGRPVKRRRSNKQVEAYQDEEADSQGSLILYDVPRLPDEIMGPLDIDDEGIVDTILELEEESMSSMDPQDGINIRNYISSCGSANAHIPDNELQNAFYDASQEQDEDLWISPDGDYPESQDEQTSDEIISPSLAAYASLALSNTEACCEIQLTPKKPESLTMTPVLYISPVKQTPLTGSNPTLSSAFMMDQDQMVSSTKEVYPDLSFISPLSTSSLINSLAQPYIIDVENITDVAEVNYNKDKELELKELELDLGKGDINLWDLEQMELMTELNSSLDELIDREVMLCSPKMMPKLFGVEHKSMEVPNGDMFLKGASEGSPQVLPSSWNSLVTSVGMQNSQDSMLEYQVVPCFLPSEGDDVTRYLSSDGFN